MFIFSLLLSLVQAKELDWKAYGIGAAATAISVPVATIGANLLTKTSNQLVAGMLPPVLFGVMTPASTAYFSTKWAREKNGAALQSGGWIYGATIVESIAIFTGETTLGISSDQWSEVLGASLVNAVLLPLPTVLAKESQVTANLSVKPTLMDNDQYNYFWTGGIHGSF